MLRFLLPAIVLTASVSAQDAAVQEPRIQNSEIQPAQVYGQDAVPEKEQSITDAAFRAAPATKWIWGADDNQKYILSREFEISGPVEAARLSASCDNVCSVFVNGRRVGGGTEWSQPFDTSVVAHLQPGVNRIHAEVENQGGVAAFVLKFAWKAPNSDLQWLVSDASWRAAEQQNADETTAVAVRANYGDGPWGAVFDGGSEAGRVPAGVFEVRAGFQVEKLYTVPREELGSWVSIAFDGKGRLIASDQGNRGLCRITLPPTGQEGAETRVEPLDFSGCEIQPTSAQGMLWAFDSLYLSINGGPGSGLYRARDLNGDDVFDECVQLKQFRGGGEHGPHALRLSPDGSRIFVICGNHTAPPFDAGEELSNADYTSRIPTNWGEDLLLPRMWDANGHARGVMAPGGWVASTDADGKTWDLWSIGYRNPYDMAFNADGELFAYDADMEWDVGTPWYRPTRVVHVTSGSEFGWRSGTGKWPAWTMDSHPPIVNIGPGSPVGAEFGYGCRFPAEYQKALFICDWTFGTMYAVHIEPMQSTYTARREEFLSRTPLPLTDVAAGPDGALYFTIGGRGTQSELYRVTYVGDENTEPAELKNSAGAGPRSLRRQFEGWHSGRAGDQVQSAADTQSLAQALAGVRNSSDRFLRTASRNAFYNSRLFEDLMKSPEALETAGLGNLEPGDRLWVLLALAKAPLETLQSREVLDADGVTKVRTVLAKASCSVLLQTDFAGLPASDRLNYLRTLSLVFLRLAEPDDAVRSGFLAQLNNHFPTSDAAVDRELCQVLVYLGSPDIVGQTVALLEQESVPTVTDDMQDLLARNRGYGRAIAASLEQAPDQQQLWYAFCLRNVKEGWTLEQRKGYFSWFERAHQWAGGASFHGFLNNIELEAYLNASEAERLLIEASGARKPYSPPEIPKPVGPGREWSLDEVRALAADGLKDRDFENGKRMFAATRCVICHRFDGTGGATGPDLTQLAGRFNLQDLTEAIMDPSKVISDQYRASTIVTAAGQTINGRIVSESETAYTVLVNAEDPSSVREVARDEVDELVASAVSIMPAKLMEPLNQDEVLDLLAYLLSRGDSRNPMFRRK